MITALVAHALFAVLILAPYQAVKGLKQLDLLVLTNRHARLEFYRAAIVSQWVLAAVALVALRGEAAAGGLVLPQVGLEALALVALASALILSQTPLVPRVHERMRGSRQTRRLLYPLRNLLPRTETERRRWVAVAVTAGICEELLFRGFLFFYLQTYWSASLYGVVSIATAIFALSHWYQGTANVVRVGVVGLLLGIVYAATGSLFFPAVLHTLLDLGALNMTDLIDSDDRPSGGDVDAQEQS